MKAPAEQRQTGTDRKADYSNRVNDGLIASKTPAVPKTCG
jgi:hypothetical protein